MLSEYGESITASAAVSSGRGQARASPSACVGKSQHVDASRSVRPSMAQAPGGTEERVCTEARAMASPSPAWVINADGRGGWVKVKICLGPGESRGEEPTDV